LFGFLEGLMDLAFATFLALLRPADSASASADSTDSPTTTTDCTYWHNNFLVSNCLNCAKLTLNMLLKGYHPNKFS
jgi:hypothetical protein